MFNLIKYIINYLNVFYGILITSFLCVVLCVIFYNKSKKFSFFFLYMALTYGYFFVILTIDVFSISVTFCYYFLIFAFYHVYFTFTKRFISRTYSVIRSYLINLHYVKLMLWGVFVFIPALFGNSFCFLIIFNSLFAFSLATATFSFFFFLLLIWSWMFILISCNKYGVGTNFLLKIQNYFGRSGCLHFIGNSPGRLLCEKIGMAIVCTPIFVSLPAIGGYALNQEAKVGQSAVSEMNRYKAQYPNATHDEMYRVYSDSYYSHGNGTIVGRTLYKWGVMAPGAPEAVISNDTSDIKTQLGSLNKK